MDSEFTGRLDGFPLAGPKPDFRGILQGLECEGQRASEQTSAEDSDGWEIRLHSKQKDRVQCAGPGRFS